MVRRQSGCDRSEFDLPRHDQPERAVLNERWYKDEKIKTELTISQSHELQPLGYFHPTSIRCRRPRLQHSGRLHPWSRLPTSTRWNRLHQTNAVPNHATEEPNSSRPALAVLQLCARP